MCVQANSLSCIFIKDDVIIIIYVDDCVIISKEDKKIAETIIELRKMYTIADEGNIEECLGIQLEYTRSSIRIARLLLIERVVDIIPGMKNSNPVN